MYYNEHIKEKVEEAWEEVLEAIERGELKGKPHTFSVRQNVCKSLYEAEPLEEQEKVQEFHHKWNKAINEGEKPGVDEEEQREVRHVWLAEDYLE